MLTGTEDTSSEFKFDDALTKEREVNEQSGKPKDIPPVNEKKGFGQSLNLAHLIGEQSLAWVRGDLEGKPVGIKQLGDDFTQKLNWYVGCTILAQYARIPALFDALGTVSETLFNNVTLAEETDPVKLMEYYKNIQKEIMQIMEFARKFVIQNKDMLADNSSFYDRSLFEKIKSMPMDQVRDYLTLFQIIESKGQNILKEIIETYK
jgi:hypothetical protein